MYLPVQLGVKVTTPLWRKARRVRTAQALAALRTKRVFLFRARRNAVPGRLPYSTIVRLIDLFVFITEPAGASRVTRSEKRPATLYLVHAVVDPPSTLYTSVGSDEVEGI
ncbi:unnamed protein product [Ectocarpus sp. 12 AP-2014]